MKKLDVNKMRERFLNYANGPDFPESLFQWEEFDRPTKQAFIWVEGEWTDEIRHQLQAYLKVGFSRKITISRMIKDGGMQATQPTALKAPT